MSPIPSGGLEVPLLLKGKEYSISWNSLSVTYTIIIIVGKKGSEEEESDDNEEIQIEMIDDNASDDNEKERKDD